MKYAPDYVQELNGSNFIIGWNTKDNDKNLLLNTINKIIMFYLWTANRKKELPSIRGCDASIKHNAKIIGMALERRCRYNFMNIIDAVNQELVEQDVIYID